ncbi:MAG: polysaccharide deacetylase family protein, partial [Clostridia bacterium]|nr:polysaccharide deacetylase family protein [Clostridia bacterium]
AERKLPIYSVEDDKRIAITFDASWGAERTKGIVDALYERGLKATFFLTGIWISAYPEETLYIHDHGMEIGNHSDHHYNMGKMTKEQCLEEIVAVNRQVYDLTGEYPTLFRAPFGDYGNTLIDTLEGIGMRCIQWDVDSLDWKGLDAATLYERITNGVQGGSIILCHNNSEHILEALPKILDDLTQEGYEFVTVSELLLGKEGTIDRTGKLHAARQGG